MEFILSDERYPQFAGLIADDNWVYLAGAYDNGFDKINLTTGEIVELKDFPEAADCYHMVKC